MADDIQIEFVPFDWAIRSAQAHRTLGENLGLKKRYRTIGRGEKGPHLALYFASTSSYIGVVSCPAKALLQEPVHLPLAFVQRKGRGRLPYSVPQSFLPQSSQIISFGYLVFTEHLVSGTSQKP